MRVGPKWSRLECREYPRSLLGFNLAGSHHCCLALYEEATTGGGLHTKGFTFGRYTLSDAVPEGLRVTLDQWADQFAGDSFAEASESVEGTKAWIVSYDDAARHSDLLADRLAKVLLELKAL